MLDSGTRSRARCHGTPIGPPDSRRSICAFAPIECNARRSFVATACRRLPVRRHSYPASEPAARNLQTPADATSPVHSYGFPEARGKNLVRRSTAGPPPDLSKRRLVEYAFMGTDADAADNRWLREAFEQRIPTSTSSASPRDGSWHRCQPSSPSGIALPSRPQSDSSRQPDMPERRSLMKRRQGAMHSAQSNNACTKRLSDRPSLLHTTGVAPSPAYPNRCCSMLRTSSATDMRHWANPSSRTACHFEIHHAAFDAHLIGIDPDYPCTFPAG
ncbi:hypothetical protein RLIN73S_06919 [Rhodanobacter lindaniclasticus]